MNRVLAIFASIAVLAGTSCNSTGNKTVSTGDSAVASVNQLPDSSNFNQEINGKQVRMYVIRNKGNSQVAITNYGGRIVSIIVPSSDSTFIDVALGFDKVEGFQQKGGASFGAVVGRFGNRIGKAQFTLAGKVYKLPANNGPNTLHGGPNGFQTQVWDANQVDDRTLELSYLSRDGEAGFPGNLKVKVTYSLTDENELKIDYQAITDKTTVLNLTNHAYFNLNGAGNGDILDHELFINADKIVPIDTTSIPTGGYMEVEGTPFDFRKSARIGGRIDEQHEQIKNGRGYDHNFVLNNGSGELVLAAKAIGPKTGIVMEVLTTEPGVQFYTGNFLNGTLKDTKGANTYDFRTGFCLETQHFPDSPNQPSFPSTTLEQGETYKTTTIYKFSVK